MNWYFVALAPGVAFAAALAFYPVRRPGTRSRTLIWLASSAIVAFSPCLIPSTSKPLRFAASLIAITLLVKLYDMYRERRLAQCMSLWSYLAYLANWFWLVLRREPRRVSVTRDFRCLATALPASLLSTLLSVSLWRQDWSALPFALEHALKVSSVVLTVVLITNALAAGYRLLGGTALDPMRNPILAKTPADFWRRWNRPAHHFLNEYAFLPAGGFRRAVRATLATFGVSGLVHEYVFGIAAGRIQGYQILFFWLQGCVVVATMSIRPSGRFWSLWIAGTLVFNLSTSVLFFQSVDAVFPFYWPRSP
jgi:D-alanyl-lipoteichoic acid acyltransferase DltB (MBOAT superfamily)